MVPHSGRAPGKSLPPPAKPGGRPMTATVMLSPQLFLRIAFAPTAIVQPGLPWLFPGRRGDRPGSAPRTFSGGLRWRTRGGSWQAPVNPVHTLRHSPFATHLPRSRQRIFRIHHRSLLAHGAAWPRRDERRRSIPGFANQIVHRLRGRPALSVACPSLGDKNTALP